MDSKLAGDARSETHARQVQSVGRDSPKLRVTLVNMA